MKIDLGCGHRLATSGYAVFGIDYEGHGRSSGARCYIKKFENIVADCYAFFTSISGMATNLIADWIIKSPSYS